MNRWGRALVGWTLAGGALAACADDPAPLPRFTTDGAPPARDRGQAMDALAIQDGAVDAAADQAVRPVDGGALDAGAPDAEPPDAARLDLGPLDAAPPDAQTPDAAPLDADPPDAALDGGAADAGSPDAEVPLGPCPADMVWVPGGVSPLGPNNVPVDLPAFCIHQLEVTAGAFNACAEAGGCAGYEGWALCRDGDPRRPHQCRADRQGWPANWIDWFRADEYCRWIGGRLPSEPEWEKAARGFPGRLWPHGDRIGCADAHYARGQAFNACAGFGGRADDALPPGGYPAALSPFGALDLAGNVKEWVDIREDPQAVPADDDPGVTRGGSWRDSAEQVSALARDTLIGHGVSSPLHGFRCVAAARP